MSIIGYDWPGNVRELANIVERSLILNPRGPLTFEILVVNPNTLRSRIKKLGIEGIDIGDDQRQ
jgi:transcriptional regulator with PAS, ATPase and Fis domain